jgi:hypothetical protein
MTSALPSAPVKAMEEYELPKEMPMAVRRGWESSTLSLAMA